jgi:TRAP-type mannitol/chloroaromatic compound transport system substrate-binding protein
MEEKLIKRRKFVAAVATTGVAAAMSAPAVHAQQTIRWRMTSSFPRGLDTLFGTAELFAERVNKLTEGRFQIRAFQAGDIVPPLQALDAVQQGTVEACQTASYYYVGKDMSFSFGTALPFGLNARQQNSWIYHGGGQALLDEFYAAYNCVGFAAGNTGSQMGGWFRNPINGLADLRGLKMRIPGIGGQIMSRLGVVPQTLAAGDVYPALERGTIDATEFVGPYDDEKLGFHRVAKNYYYPGWWEPSAMLTNYINKDRWESLPPLFKEAIASAAREANVDMMARYDAVNAAAVPRLLQAGVTFRAFPDDIMQAAQRETTAFFTEEAGRNPRFKKIWDSWSAFRQSSAQWFSYSELAQESFAGRLARPG